MINRIVNNVLLVVVVLSFFLIDLGYCSDFNAEDVKYKLNSSNTELIEYLKKVKQIKQDEPYQLTQNTKEEIEVFIDGKNYSSLRKYKIEKLTEIFRKALIDSNESLKGLKEDELLALMLKLKDTVEISKEPVSLVVKDKQLIEMQQMLERANKKLASKVELDKDKIKTIIIK